jgi:hypothetical protein
MKSTSTGRSYDLYIHTPSDYEQNKGAKYPVLYILDGQWDFKLMDSVLGGLVYDKFVPEMILVGITYSGENADYNGLRAMDYTPTPTPQVKGSGDGPKFLNAPLPRLLGSRARDARARRRKARQQQARALQSWAEVSVRWKTVNRSKREVLMEDESRRRFLTVLSSAIPACCLAGRETLNAAARVQTVGEQATKPEAPTHKFQDKSEMTWEQVYDFAYLGGFVNFVTALAKRIDKDNYIDVLKQLSSETAAAGIRERPNPDPSLANFVAFAKKPDDFWNHVLSLEIVQDTPEVFEVRVRECLWAKTFRKQNAAEVGYACMCHPDFAVANAYNPKLRMERTKTLMQGDEYCNHRWVMEA